MTPWLLKQKMGSCRLATFFSSVCLNAMARDGRLEALGSSALDIRFDRGEIAGPRLRDAFSDPIRRGGAGSTHPKSGPA